MHDPPASVPHRLWQGRYVIIYVALATALLGQVVQFHQSDTGFSSMVRFGDAFQDQRLSRLHDIPIYTFTGTAYDGQFYAQLAVAGNPLDPELGTALDSAPYRTRRILLPILAHFAGLGRPAWVVQVYALSNVLCWLVLALLLARWWFPPNSLHNLLRWTGTLFGAGMLTSITQSLTDGPALLCIAFGVRLAEKAQGLMGAALLGAAGLVRETSVLCAAAFFPATNEEWRDWRRRALAAAICILPIFVWVGFLTARYGSTGNIRNFDLPLVSYVRELREIAVNWRAHGFDSTVRDLVWAVIALGTQVGFVLARPRLDQMWWRIGATFAILWLCLGWPVWEGPWPAAPRVLLPLTLAFNVLAPKSPSGYALLLAGNLTVLSATHILTPPPVLTVVTEPVTCSFAEGWHGREQLERRTWHWAAGSAALKLHNPTAETQFISFEFQLGSVTQRTVTMHAPGIERSFTFGDTTRQLRASFGPLPVPPGDTAVNLTTPEPPWVESGANGRGLTFALGDLHVRTGAAISGIGCVDRGAQ